MCVPHTSYHARKFCCCCCRRRCCHHFHETSARPKKTDQFRCASYLRFDDGKLRPLCLPNLRAFPCKIHFWCQTYTQSEEGMAKKIAKEKYEAIATNGKERANGWIVFANHAIFPHRWSPNQPMQFQCFLLCPHFTSRPFMFASLMAQKRNLKHKFCT